MFSRYFQPFISSVIVFFGAALLPLSAGEATYHDCYARWSDAELTVGNSLVERKWSIRQGLLSSVSFHDKRSGREWLSAPGAAPAPSPEGLIPNEKRELRVTTRSGRQNSVEAESLVIDLQAVGDEASYSCRMKVFPLSAGITIQFGGDQDKPADSKGVESSGESAAPSGLEGPLQKAKPKDQGLGAVEDLLLSQRHLQFTSTILADHTTKGQTNYVNVGGRDHRSASGWVFSTIRQRLREVWPVRAACRASARVVWPR